MNQSSPAARTILEPASELRVCAEADVVVVGGGPGGIGAAVAAARNGAKTVLVERYGHLGGMATGGLVIIIPHMSDGTRDLQIAGICDEWIDRTRALGGARNPRKEDLGSSDNDLTDYWRRFIWAVVEGKLRYTVYLDPEMQKCALNEMVTEAGINLYLHSWGSRALVVDGAVKGVVFESKSGRQAILGQVIIDATGDGDLLPSAGAEFDAVMDRSIRLAQLALVYRLGNVDYDKYADFRAREPERHMALTQELANKIGFRMSPHPSSRNDVMWVNNWLIGYDATNVEDLTKVELTMRKAMLEGLAFWKKRFPGMENAYILDTASQVGTRGSRRLIGERVVTHEDVKSGRTYPDTIAVFPDVNHNTSPEHPLAHIPYGALVPRDVDGLLIAGRHFSADAVTSNLYNWIPHCIALGEAAGTAAALSVRHSVRARDVNRAELQRRLLDQGVPLPGVAVAGAKQ